MSFFLLHGTRSFTPTQVANNVLWLDASDSNTITERGGAVSQWDDKSGEGNNIPVTGTQRPTTGVDTINGKNVLTFDGVNNYLDLPSSFYTDLANGDNTAIVVWKTSNGGTSQRLITGFVGTSTRWGLLYRFGAGEVNAVNATTFAQVDTPLIENINTHVDISIREGSNITAKRDKYFNETDATAEDVSITSARIGADAFGANLMVGNLCEVLVYNRALTESEIALVQNYLQAKWDIQALDFAYAPKEVSNLVGMYDPALTGGHTYVGNIVTQYNDLSGNSNNLSVVGAPKTGTRTLNGLNCFDLDGSVDGFDMPSALYDIPDGGDFSILMAMAPDDTSSTFIMNMNDGTADQPKMKIESSGTNYRVQCGNAQSNQTIVADTDAHVFSMIREGVAVEGFYDGVGNGSAVASDRTPTNGTFYYRLTGTPSSLDFFNGRGGSIAFYDKALSALEYDFLDWSKQQRWGVA